MPSGPVLTAPSSDDEHGSRNLLSGVTIGHTDGDFGARRQPGHKEREQRQRQRHGKERDAHRPRHAAPQPVALQWSLCGNGGEANRLGFGQRRDRIELVKVSTASSCLGGAFGTEPITRPATRRSPAWAPSNRRRHGCRAGRSVAHGQERSSPRWLAKTQPAL